MVNKRDIEFEVTKTDFMVITLHGSSTWGKTELGRSETFKVPYGRHVQMHSIGLSETGQVPMSSWTVAIARTMNGAYWRSVSGDPDESGYIAQTEWQEDHYYDWQQGMNDTQNAPKYDSATSTINAPRYLWTISQNMGHGETLNMLINDDGDSGENHAGLWLQPNDAIYIFASNSYSSYYGNDYYGAGDYHYPTATFTYTEYY